MARKLNRRMFLRGAAGFSLAIPFLSSIAEPDAQAQATHGIKRFIAFGTEHGGVWQNHMYPSDATLTQTMSYAGHTIRNGALSLSQQDGIASLSPVLSASSARLTSALAQKMNVLRGLDIPLNIGHHTGGHLGNYALNHGDAGDGLVAQQNPRPTIDQVLAWSPSFYPDLGSILERSLVIGRPGMSAGFSQPSTQSGEIQQITPESNNVALFNRIFVAPTDPQGPTRPPIVDRVLDDYRRLRDSNRRMSSRDRQRLSDHLDRVDELERRLNVVLSCEEIPQPAVNSDDLPEFIGNVEAQIQYWQLINDVIVAALACDTCRVVSALLSEMTTMSDYTGNWHQEIAHQADFQQWGEPPTAEQGHPHTILAASKQRFFEHVFLDLMGKLDAVDDGDGATLLDNSLLQWSQESGPATHESIETPLVTAGGAGGYLRTGQYCDYRNTNALWRVAEPNFVVETHRGLLYNQWLGTALQAMGLDPSEYETGGYGGYGDTYFGYEGYYPSTGGHVSSLSDPLPFLQA